MIWNVRVSLLDSSEKDLDDLPGTCSRLETRMRDTIQIQAAELSLEEPRRSIEQAKALGKLTQLAFIFIPVMFITGVFGTNITPFSGEGPMWGLWVASVTLSASAFAFWRFIRLDKFNKPLVRTPCFGGHVSPK